MFASFTHSVLGCTKRTQKCGPTPYLCVRPPVTLLRVGGACRHVCGLHLQIVDAGHTLNLWLSLYLNDFNCESPRYT